MSTVLTHDLWNASEYNKHSIIQSEAAIKLLNTLPLADCTNILDIGCGDGKLTALIAEKTLYRSNVTGIDKSHNMIVFATSSFASNSTYNNLQFRQQDAKDLSEKNKFDLVFSSFALQWVPNLQSCLKKIKRSLRRGGIFAATIPCSISLELQTAIDQITNEERWNRFFQSKFDMPNFYSAPELTKLLIESQFHVDICKLETQCHHFQDALDFKNYIRQWLPHLQLLSEVCIDDFLDAIIAAYLQLIPKSRQIQFTFDRIDIVAKRPF